MPLSAREAVTARVARFRQRMAAADVDLALFYSNAHHSLLAADPVRWISGFKPMGPHTLALLPAEGPATLIVSPAWDGERAREQTTFEQVIAEDDFAEAVTRALPQRTTRTGLVGGRRLTRATRDLIA